MAYKVRTRILLTSDGQMGVRLLLGSPIAQALAAGWLLYWPHWFPAAIAVAATVALVGGGVLLTIGREYESYVDQVGEGSSK